MLGSGNNASIEVNGNISDGTLSGGGLSIYTEDSGTVLLSGNNTYTGSTVHQGGTLLVNNAAGSGTGFGTVRVKSGATFSGNGIVAPTGANDVVFESGSIVNPGNIAAGEKLTFDLGDTTGKVIFESGAIVLIDVSADAGMVDYLNFVGVISGSGDVIFNNNVINFAVSGGILADGIYTLASFSADNAYTGRLVLGSGLEGHNATLLFNANSIQLQIGTIPEPSTFGLLSGIAILVTVFVVRRRR